MVLLALACGVQSGGHLNVGSEIPIRHSFQSPRTNLEMDQTA